MRFKGPLRGTPDSSSSPASIPSVRLSVAEMVPPSGPIYIGGPDRCGKTLLAAILGSHTRIAIPIVGSNLWTHFYGQYGDLADDRNLDRCLAGLQRYKHARFLGLDIERIRRELRAGARSYARLFALIDIDEFTRLLEQPWLIIPTITAAFSLAVHVTDVRVELLRGIRTLGLTLLSWLLPPMTVVAGGFLAALAFTGLQPLWAASSRPGATRSSGSGTTGCSMGWSRPGPRSFLSRTGATTP